MNKILNRKGKFNFVSLIVNKKVIIKRLTKKIKYIKDLRYTHKSFLKIFRGCKND